jgi:hypothetical protein
MQPFPLPLGICTSFLMFSGFLKNKLVFFNDFNWLMLEKKFKKIILIYY